MRLTNGRSASPIIQNWINETDRGKVPLSVFSSPVDTAAKLFYDTEMSARASIGRDFICNGRQLPLNRRNTYVADFYPCNHDVVGLGGAVL